ncbi:MAG TPA: 2-succinyl-5-enolpyruvyl-6-hydroxy-3-cyclohexene-1-carboxylic-acid synthase [Bacillales bacterium]|nr:2-succinyl-5-enolpyruvyl-6-hydroxy-3-cyclohexene-1-carboxylic-acid synthase [Bacillales bacterium]
MTHGQTLSAYVGTFVDELYKSGVHHAVVCPGSRSTPIALTLAEHPEMKVWMHVDERSAAYFALGIAKVNREPVVILCSSGTAAANFFPAVVESSQDRIPLIVLTADRPHELRDVGAPQAIDQIKIYGDYVKWFSEMALPEATDNALRYVGAAAVRAVSTALSAPRGPVHLNFPFREPLIPDFPFISKNQSEKARLEVSEGMTIPDATLIEKLALEWNGIERGLIVCGPQDEPGFPAAVTELAEKLQFPILADPLSQLRSGAHEKMLVIDGYDAFLRNEEAACKLAPDVVLRFGAMPTSKAFMLYMKKHPKCRLIVVDEGGWRDPIHQAANMVMCNPVWFCRALSCEVDHKQAPEWAKRWARLNEETKKEIERFSNVDRMSEGQVFSELRTCLPDGSLLFAGNSMPVRDLDTFFTNQDAEIRMMANRGANGIDGIVSSALGAATSCNPLVLVIGDLSFYHDLNGLLAAKLHSLNATIVVINNNGGGIFSFLPQANQTDHFEQLFGTPTDLAFQQTVQMYGGIYKTAETVSQFRNDVKTSIASEGLTVIEVRTNREENTKQHRKLWANVSKLVRKCL